MSLYATMSIVHFESAVLGGRSALGGQLWEGS